MILLLSAALRSCSFFSSSAAFFLNRRRSFFFLSGVIKPFFAFLALEASSMRFRTSARFLSISACFAFFASSSAIVVGCP
uniref:Uncharacterized protein n=1 Tax=Panstrongylus lignarius TaxID=156445 RepID=A0A224Y531_9HEMI